MGSINADAPAVPAAGPSVDDRGSQPSIDNIGGYPGEAARRGRISGSKPNEGGREVRKAPRAPRFSK